MKRRTFIQMMSAATAAALLPTTVQAADEYTGPLYIFVHADGGWDPTSLCDPKGHEDGDADPMNKQFKTSEIKQSSSGSNISYAPLGEDYKFQTFFDKYGQDLLIINGINSQTNGHSSGERYAGSGQLSEGLPSLAALVAGIHLPSSPMAYLGNGGYRRTEGVTAATRIDNATRLEEISLPNTLGSGSFHSDSAFSRLEEKRGERLARLRSNQSLDNVFESLKQFDLTHASAADLKKINEHVPADINTHEKRRNTIFTQGRLAIAGYKAGLTVSLSVRMGGFDTHGNHDGNHDKRLQDVLEGIDLLMDDAKANGVGNDIVIIVESEFGRTPGYNDSNGKDHWTTTSMMMMGKGITGNRVVGQTTDRHKYMKLDANTLAVDEENGVTMTFAHVHKSLRTNMGIDTHPLANEVFRIPTSVESLPIVI